MRKSREMIPPITDDLNKETNHSLESNILLSVRPIVKYPRIKFWFRLSAQIRLMNIKKKGKNRNV